MSLKPPIYTVGCVSNEVTRALRIKPAARTVVRGARCYSPPSICHKHGPVDQCRILRRLRNPMTSSGAQTSAESESNATGYRTKNVTGRLRHPSASVQRGSKRAGGGEATYQSFKRFSVGRVALPGFRHTDQKRQDCCCFVGRTNC